MIPWPCFLLSYYLKKDPRAAPSSSLVALYLYRSTIHRHMISVHKTESLILSSLSFCSTHEECMKKQGDQAIQETKRGQCEQQPRMRQRRDWDNHLLLVDERERNDWNELNVVNQREIIGVCWQPNLFPMSLPPCKRRRRKKNRAGWKSTYPKHQISQLLLKGGVYQQK